MTLRLNVRGGLLRLWIFLSICWIVLCAGVLGERSLTTVLGPVAVFGALLAGLLWVAKGFKFSSASLPTLCQDVVKEHGHQTPRPATQSNTETSDEANLLWTYHPWFISDGIEVIECSEALRWTHGYRCGYQETTKARLEQLQARTSDKLHLYQCDTSEQTNDLIGVPVWKHPAERASFLTAQQEYDAKTAESSRRYYASLEKKKRNDRISNVVGGVLLFAAAIWYARNAHFSQSSLDEFWSASTRASFSIVGLWTTICFLEQRPFIQRLQKHWLFTGLVPIFETNS
jgi:hypothetical protein